MTSQKTSTNDPKLEQIAALLAKRSDTDDGVAVAAGSDLADFIADDGKRRQSLRGFEDMYADIVHYIIRSTDRIWDGDAGTDLIKSHYAPEVPLHTSEGTAYGRANVIEMTKKAKRAYPGILLHAEDVVWSGNDRDGFHTSHRITHMGRNDGPSVYGSATGRSFRRAAVAHCFVVQNRIVDEWLARDELALVRALGLDELALAESLGTAEAAARGSLVCETALPPGTELPAPASAEEDLVRSMFRDVWSEGRLGDLPDYYDPDAYVSTATSRVLTGPGGYLQYVVGWQDEFSDVSLTVDHMMSNKRAGGEIVATRWWIEGSHDGETRYGRSTGRRVRVLGFSHNLVVDRRIVAEWTVFDEFALLKQIYATEPLAANRERSQRHAD
ncbi:MAG: ester cyclase [Acidimicrobiia bacterium]